MAPTKCAHAHHGVTAAALEREGVPVAVPPMGGSRFEPPLATVGEIALARARYKYFQTATFGGASEPDRLDLGQTPMRTKGFRGEVKVSVKVEEVVKYLLLFFLALHGLS
jgi:hypothetical protein